MNTTAKVLGLLLLIVTGFSINNVQAQQYDLAVLNASLIDVHTGAVTVKNVGISRGIIRSVQSGAVKARKTINAKGMYLLPGLSDMHVHYPAADTRLFFDLCVANGITSIRMMNSEPAALTFKEKYEEFIPKLYIGFPLRDDRVIDNADTFMDSIAGYDFVKIFSLKTGAYFQPLMAAAAKRNKPVCGHALANVDAAVLMNAGYRSIEHLGYFDRAGKNKLDSLLNIAAASDIYFCPTLDWELKAYHAFNKDSLPFTATDYLGTKLYRPKWDSLYAEATKSFGANAPGYQQYAKNQHDKKITILKQLFARQLRVIAGSDAEEPYQLPGQALLDELYLLKKTGVSNLTVLQTVTLNPARYFGDKQEARIIVGSPANLVLLQKNPLDDLKNLETSTLTIMRGQVFEKKKLIAKWIKP
jgi:imidazolonepropionase-like amidohydrolase